VTGPEARAALADRCPLCGEANGCAIAAGSATRCWCSQATFTAAVRERATNAGGAARCICARCAHAAAEVDRGWPGAGTTATSASR
jgi:hypothetical protein